VGKDLKAIQRLSKDMGHGNVSYRLVLACVLVLAAQAQLIEFDLSPRPKEKVEAVVQKPVLPATSILDTVVPKKPVSFEWSHNFTSGDTRRLLLQDTYVLHIWPHDASGSNCTTERMQLNIAVDPDSEALLVQRTH
jgi:hypothetical protein